jgi:AmpE protein
MTFIVTLIALVLERFFHWHHLRQWQWLQRYDQWLNPYTKEWPPYLRLIINIAPSLIIVGVINCLLQGVLYGFLQLIFATIILLYCLGPENLWVQIYHTMNATDKEAGRSVSHETVVRSIFIIANERIFAVIFWFVILGPIGAVLYRLIYIFSTEPVFNLTALATQLKRYLDWLPIRLFTFLFALGGNFTAVLAYWKQVVFKGVETNETLLGEAGVLALNLSEGEQFPEAGVAEQQALDLIDRALIIALVLLAILVLLL